MAVGSTFAHTRARRNSDGGIFKLTAKTFLKLADKAAHDLGSTHIVHNKTVTDDLGKFQSTGNRLTLAVHHHDHDVRGAEVNAHVELLVGRDLSNGADAAFKLGYAALNSSNVH
jgi:hypothetical protein